MNEFKIITGCAKECEKELNNLSKKYLVIVLGFSADKDQTTIMLEIGERNQ